MSKIVVPGWYNSATRTIRCARCNCVFAYTDDDVYEQMAMPPMTATHDFYGYVRDVVDCPECGWQAPALRMKD